MTVALREEFGESDGIVSLDWRTAPPGLACRNVVTVGNFDGVHAGHVALVLQTKELAQILGTSVTVLTFDPHPLRLIAPDQFQPPLTTPMHRAALLRAAGADAVSVLRIDADLLNLTPDAFFQQILIERFQAKGIVEGFNFRFGHNRAGSVQTLLEMCGKIGIPFRQVEPFHMDGIVVSSSRVRNALLAGDVTEAAKLLNRPYRIQGTVIAGAKRGRTIGFPTANLGNIETLLPAEGVYAARAFVGDKSWLGAANLGPNPTFAENARKIEVHLLDFQGDLYGQTLSVEFVRRLRETRKFSGIDELVRQMKVDIEQVRRIIP